MTAAVFALLALAHVWFANELPHFRQPNGWSRLYLALAIAEEGGFAVDAQVARYGRIEDLATHAGRTFSDKAPGASLLLAPIAWALRRTLVPMGADPASMAIALRLLGVSLPALLFWFATRRAWGAWAGGARRGLAVILAGALGTPFFVHATTLFAHAVAGMLAFAGFLLIRSAADRADPALARIAAAGLCIGMAFVSDFVLLLAAPVLAAYAVLCRPERRLARALALGAGALGPALFLLVYDQICFGNPFSVGFHHHADPAYRAGYASGLFGIQTPGPRALLELTLLPRRGLLAYAPVLALAPLGWWSAWRRPEARAETLAAAATSASILLFAATTVDWSGGWSFGPRYLVPAIPFLLTGVAAALREAAASGPTAIAFRALACAGLVATALGAASFPFFPREFESPLWQLALPLLLEGHRMPGLLAQSAVPFALLVAASCGFVAFGAWRGAWRAGFVSLAIAAGLLFAMARAAPPATSDLHQAALAMVFQAIGR